MVCKLCLKEVVKNLNFDYHSESESHMWVNIFKLNYPERHVKIYQYSNIICIMMNIVSFVCASYCIILLCVLRYLKICTFSTQIKKFLLRFFFFF